MAWSPCGWYLPMTSPTTRLDFTCAAVGAQAQLAHPVEDAALHRLEPVAGVGQGAGVDDASTSTRGRRSCISSSTSMSTICSAKSSAGGGVLVRGAMPGGAPWSLWPSPASRRSSPTGVGTSVPPPMVIDAVIRRIRIFGPSTSAPRAAAYERLGATWVPKRPSGPPGPARGGRAAGWGSSGAGTAYPRPRRRRSAARAGMPNASWTASWRAPAAPRRTAPPRPSSTAVSSMSMAAMPVSTSQ